MRDHEVLRRKIVKYPERTEDDLIDELRIERRLKSTPRSMTAIHDRIPYGWTLSVEIPDRQDVETKIQQLLVQCGVDT